jgi:hypothetical protein
VKPVAINAKLPVMMRPTRAMSFGDFYTVFHDSFLPQEQLLLVKVETDPLQGDLALVTFIRENGKLHTTGWLMEKDALLDAELVE